MKVREEFERFNEKVAQDVERMEQHHDEKVVDRKEAEIEKEEERAIKHEQKLDALKNEKPDFVHRMEEDVAKREVKHDEAAIARDQAKIVTEEKKEDLHASKEYSEQAKIDTLDGELKK